MKRNFSTTLKSFDGQVFKSEDGKDLTLADVCVNALGRPQEGDVRLDGQAKVGLFLLAGRIHAGGEVEVSAEEIATLKQRIATLYGPFVVGAAWGLLESQ